MLVSSGRVAGKTPWCIAHLLILKLTYSSRVAVSYLNDGGNYTG